MTGRRRFGVVIVNYNCALLAIDAALSALGAGGEDARVVIVDNASPDGSARFFRDFFEGRRSRRPQPPKGGPRRVRFADPGSLAVAVIDETEAVPRDADLVIALSSENAGFAAGCNQGMKAVIAGGGADFFLLLNPDALLAEGALEAFAERLRDAQSGLCGASVLRFDDPARAQAFGGASLDPLTLQGRNLGEGRSFEERPATESIERQLSYPLGCAMALRSDYLEAAGFLDERYFLYYEEVDWTRAGSRRPLWARDAVVYHRYGGSSKSRSSDRRSPLSDYHMARSRLLFALKWAPLHAPLMLILAAFQALRRLLQGRAAEARAVALGALPGAPRRFASR